MDNFDKLLVQTISEVMRYALGEINAKIICDYLEKRHFPLTTIPNNLEVFSIELRNLLGPGRGQILGSAPMLEKVILKALCKKLGLKYEVKGPINFSEEVRKLKEIYCNEKVLLTQNVFAQENGGEKIA